MSEWIDVNDRLPEENVVVILSEDGNFETGWYGHGTEYMSEKLFTGFFIHNTGYDGDSAHSQGNVTHWQPLPEPPKEDDNGKIHD
jgi:hypothetical protein